MSGTPACIKYRPTSAKDIQAKREAGRVAEIAVLRSTNDELKKRVRTLKSSLVATRNEEVITRSINTVHSIQIKEHISVMKEMADFRKTIKELKTKNAEQRKEFWDLDYKFKLLLSDLGMAKKELREADELNKHWAVWATRLEEVLIERGATTRDEIHAAQKQMAVEVSNDIDGDYVRV